ncbi:hypothetical protein [Streptomyces sp. NPDC090022]|uniref:hypothetical protein n=1 Tax=Streptomyces sp. NPDC090022 TaxID=3365920 RepID=UPI003818CF7C
MGYSNGALRGLVGTAAVLLTAALIASALRHWRVAAMTTAGVLTAAGIGWLATH